MPLSLADNQARFIRQAIAGGAWLVTCAWFLAVATGHSFAVIFPVVSLLLLGFAALGIWWMAGRVELAGSRARQFGIATLLGAMLLVAGLLAVARWIVSQHYSSRGLVFDDNATMAIVMVATTLLLMLLISLPLLLGLLDSLLHLTIWLLRRFARR